MGKNNSGNGGGGGGACAEHKQKQRRDAAAAKAAANKARNRANKIKKAQRAANPTGPVMNTAGFTGNTYTLVTLTPEGVTTARATWRELEELAASLTNFFFSERPLLAVAYKRSEDRTDARTIFPKGLKLPFRVHSSHEGFTLVEKAIKDGVPVGYEPIREVEVGEMPEEMERHFRARLASELARERAYA